MTKVLLLNPPYEYGKFVRVERCMQPASAWAALWPPLPLMYGQAILDEHGFKTKLIDAVAEDLMIAETCEKVEEFNPDIICFNIAMQTFSSDSKVLSYVKKNLPNCITVATGVIGSLYPEFLRKTNSFDYVIVSDIEYALLEICRKNKKTKTTKFIKRTNFDLNQLPFPALYDLDLDKYVMPFTKERFTLVCPARGCAYRCNYCIVPIIFSSVRYRKPKNFVDELERDMKEYGIRNFMFWTETFTQNLGLAEDICKEIIKRGLDINWMATTRVDCVTPKVLRLMNEAGCFMISYGIETLNKRILDLCGKHVTIEQIERAVDLAKNVGLEIMAHIIIGLPGMKRSDVTDAINWLIEKDISYAQFYCATPYPKTGLARMAEKNNWLTNSNPNIFIQSKAPMRNEYMSTDEIEALRRWAYRKFYLRPGFILRQIKKYPLLNLVSSGLYFAKDWVLK